MGVDHDSTVAFAKSWGLFYLIAMAAGVLIYALINAAALVRVIGGLWLEAYQPLLVTSAVLWCLAFLTFAVVYGPMLIGPRPQAQA